MWSRVGGVVILKFHRYYFWTVDNILRNDWFLRIITYILLRLLEFHENKAKIVDFFFNLSPVTQPQICLNGLYSKIVDLKN